VQKDEEGGDGMAAPFVIGTDAICTDGVCGHVSRVVVDPADWAVTHLVVVPSKPQELGRLVPINLVDAAAGEIRLRCTTAEFYNLSRGEKTEFVQGTGDYSKYKQGQSGSQVSDMENLVRSGLSITGRLPQTFTYDSIPPGKVAVRGGDHVHATDGDIGKVDGVAVAPGSHHVTHVLLREGHIWGHRQVAIPTSAVTRIDAGVQLNITKQQVKHLPPVILDRPSR
jgi:hypothetical protein